MEIDEMVALITGIVFALAYAFMLLKNTLPFIKQSHKISILKERGGLITAEAEVVEVETRYLNGLKVDPNKLYIMRIRYCTERAARGIEHAELIFAKEPDERTGQNITVLYSRDEPSDVMTLDNRESAGTAMMFIKLAISVVISFTGIYLLMYTAWTIS
ncbi:MAG: DUF3592 domain-containing protein [Oscillospiraceae bacterium]|nr:DUF3592 domain-containing protein [Oscillospiraceae bacterium]